MSGGKFSGWDRQDFFQVAAAASLVAAAPRAASAAQPSENEANVAPQPTPQPDPDTNTSDIVVETLIDWGATHVFGIVGDGINSIIEALRKRQDRIRYIGVRHEEAAAFMASGWAKHTGGLGVCVGTTGPGAIHLMNGLYDAAFDGAPVVALTGLTFHDLRGVRYQQSVDTVKLMEPLTVYNEEVTGPEHAILIANRACRAALSDRGVAHLAIGKDVQSMKLSADKRSMRNPGARSSSYGAHRCRRLRRSSCGRPPPSSMPFARRGASRAGRVIRPRGSYPAGRPPWRTRGQGAVRQSGFT
jgi:pyruvate dehydrogenase (quinone)